MLFDLVVNTDELAALAEQIDFDALYHWSRDGLEDLAVGFIETDLFKELQENPHYLVVMYVAAKLYPVYEGLVNLLKRIVSLGED